MPLDDTRHRQLPRAYLSGNSQDGPPAAQTYVLGSVPPLVCVFTVLLSFFSSLEKMSGAQQFRMLAPPLHWVLPHSLSFWPHTELHSWSWGPPSCQLLLSPMSLWSGRGTGCHRYSCPSCGSGRLACHRCWVLCSLWGGLGLKCPEVRCHVAPDPGRWIFSSQVKPAGFHSTDLQPSFLPLDRGGIWTQSCYLGLVQQCFFSFKQPTGATFSEMKDEKTVRLPARII